MLLNTLLATTAFILFVSAQEESSKRLKVSVYYETLCGDIKRFIRSQLHPLKKSALGNLFDIEFVPYGKATTTQRSDGSYIFQCQHANAECEGNRMHACAVKYISDSQLLADFIHCSMSSSYPPTSLSQCAQSLGIDTTNIASCSRNPNEGDELLAANGRKTHGLSPKLFFVPWITINDIYVGDEDLQQSQRDFQSVLCNHVKSKLNMDCNEVLATKS